MILARIKEKLARRAKMTDFEKKKLKDVSSQPQYTVDRTKKDAIYVKEIIACGIA